jgi:hypothetical protein
MATRTLLSNITENGVNQGDLVKLLNNIVDAINEINTDGDAYFADITALRAAVVAITAKLDADGGVTDTNYAATCNPAAVTSTAVSASTLTLNKG